MVASSRARAREKGDRSVSIPFIAGQWSLPERDLVNALQKVVSIPFIAGQWSLHGGGGQGGPPHGSVSIPFIAGQWSLLDPERAKRLGNQVSQSPSLRGSGRFPPAAWRRGKEEIMSQSPSLRGSGRFSTKRWVAMALDHVKSQSPSLRGSGRFAAEAADAAPPRTSQSPSLRGSGRF